MRDGVGLSPSSPANESDDDDYDGISRGVERKKEREKKRAIARHDIFFVIYIDILNHKNSVQLFVSCSTVRLVVGEIMMK